MRAASSDSSDTACAEVAFIDFNLTFIQVIPPHSNGQFFP